MVQFDELQMIQWGFYMSDQLTDQQLFLEAVKTFVGTVRSSLCGDNPTPSHLADSVQAAAVFKVAAAVPGGDSFRMIADQLDIIFCRHSTGQTLPDKLELELIELAIDWLAELAILHEEDLPEPKSLVSELLHTFKLVESSQEAITLAELLANRTVESLRDDPFADDPGFSVKPQSVPSHRDPFADDPGFGLEFDLLQRTVNLLAESKFVAGGANLSVVGNASRDNHPSSDPSVSEHDPFADDPPLSK